MANLPLVEGFETSYGADEDAMAAYRASGTERALAISNRGPIRYDADGRLAADILDAYNEHGFYVFTGVISADELADIEADVAEMLDRAPTHGVQRQTVMVEPAIGVDCQARNISWVKPLADPLGGTDYAHGRHPAKMNEPSIPEGAPEHVVQLFLGNLQFSQACLRLYAHPDLLRVAEAIHGPDFTPFNEALWIKQPHLGGSVAWHQDGWTHWDSPDLDANTHGFNFMGQLYGCDAENGLWVVPGSHRIGKADIKAMVEAAGSDRLPEAVPVICDPGDVAICNRQAIHGSFANTSVKPRITMNFGFHRRASVLGIESGGVHNPVSTYDEDYIRERSGVIMYAIDARRQRFPDEAPYEYAPLASEADAYRFDDSTMAKLKDYNLKDLGI